MMIMMLIKLKVFIRVRGHRLNSVTFTLLLCLSDSFMIARCYYESMLYVLYVKWKKWNSHRVISGQGLVECEVKSRLLKFLDIQILYIVIVMAFRWAQVYAFFNDVQLSSFPVVALRSWRFAWRAFRKTLNHDPCIPTGPSLTRALKVLQKAL